MNPADVIELKPLGTSPVQIPAIGFGTWRYHGGVAPLRAVVERGPCLIDTAENYANEEMVGEAIRGHRHDVFVATKATPRNFQPPDLIRAAENSLRRLGTDYIDLYQLHWPNLKVPIGKTMAAMEKLADAGKIRFIGVSNFSVRGVRQAQAALSRHKLAAVQIRYSLVDRTIESGLLPYCQRQRISILAFSPLGLEFWRMKQADPEGALGQIAQATGKTEARVALNWVISKDQVVAIAKASTVPHALEDREAAGWRLTPEQLAFLDRKVRCERHGWLYSAARYCNRYLSQSLGRDL